MVVYTAVHSAVYIADRTRSYPQPCTGNVHMYTTVYTAAYKRHTAAYTAVYASTQPCLRPVYTRCTRRPVYTRCTRHIGRVHGLYTAMYGLYTGMYTVVYTGRKHGRL